MLDLNSLGDLVLNITHNRGNGRLYQGWSTYPTPFLVTASSLSAIVFPDRMSKFARAILKMGNTASSSKVPRKDSPVLIVGGGTWGISIAYRLARRGYTNVTVLDPNDILESVAAGNDLNKILEEPLSAPFPEQDDRGYAWATIEKLASEVWKTDPIYSPHYHAPGFIYSAVGQDAWLRVNEEAQSHPSAYRPLNDADAFRKTMPAGVLTGDFPGWKGFFRSQGAGWVEARDALVSVCEEAKKAGVTFVTGEKEGKVVELLRSAAGEAIIGARTGDGKEHLANTTILAAGATSALLLDFEKQLRPTAWTLAHVPLTPEEAERYSDLPVLFGADRGFFISPPKSSIEAGKPELKICDEHPGYINLVSNGKGEKVPIPYRRQAIPSRSEEKMRRLLRETMPHLVDRPLLRPRLCWDADTPDRLFLISRHPKLSNLVVAAGGSGHGFMCSPAVAILVAGLLEDKIEPRVRKALGWRPETAVDRDWFATQGRFGGDGRVVDLPAEIGERDWFGGDRAQKRQSWATAETDDAS